MTTQERKRFKAMIEAGIADLDGALHKSRDRFVVLQAADPMDQIRSREDQDLDSQTANVMTVRLRRLESALLAIQDGTFGECTACDEQIPLKRIEAVPWTTLCVSCQERAEAEGSECGGLMNSAQGMAFLEDLADA